MIDSDPIRVWNPDFRFKKKWHFSDWLTEKSNTNTINGTHVCEAEIRSSMLLPRRALFRSFWHVELFTLENLNRGGGGGGSTSDMPSSLEERRFHRFYRMSGRSIFRFDKTTRFPMHRNFRYNVQHHQQLLIVILSCFYMICTAVHSFFVNMYILCLAMLSWQIHPSRF